LVDNPFGVDLGDIAPGDVITGSYTYNSKTTDTNDFVLVGDYQYDKKKYGMQLDMGSFSTQTVDFGIEIVNDYNDMDNYLVGSYNIVSTGPRVEHISWQLDDPTQTAVSSDALPTTAPVLSSWERNRLVVAGGNWL
jgi:hypothetical protein